LLNYSSSSFRFLLALVWKSIITFGNTPPPGPSGQVPSNSSAASSRSPASSRPS